MKQLSTSIQTFSEFIGRGCLYVDKTEYLWKLVSGADKEFFLSRPRRFGKSLTLSTLEAIFQGRRELFDGLAISQKDYDWKKYPVIHLDMGNCDSRTPEELSNYLEDTLFDCASSFELELRGSSKSKRFEFLISDLYNQGPVVILIDEYDKPILQNIGNPRVEQILDVLKGFYSSIKTCEENIRFAFITGVSKFSHTSFFSELNNLTDITLNTDYAGMLGFTKDELVEYFGDRLELVAKEQNKDKGQILSQILSWYDGYRFSEQETRVCNPVSITKFFFSNGKFHNYWHDTGTPSFLLKLARDTQFDFEKELATPVSDLVFKPYRLSDMDVKGLLWQAGYLTIKNIVVGRTGKTRYRLDYPNKEVKETFVSELLAFYSGSRDVDNLIEDLLGRIISDDLPEFMKSLRVFFANMPCDIKIKQEKYYQSLFYALFYLLGLYIEAESRSNDGRSDAYIKTATHLYIFEFKLNKSADEAVEQIMDNEYYVKFQRCGLPIVAVGVNFDYEKGQITSWKELPLPENV